ncbi:MAG: hypothetical protein A3J08_01310 [Candidatus Lloydbacteria bacterium RIFCSPLOWO2_02_FULL_51_11]|uniref:Capsule synthesis protein CapA domain-containing protein n=2 Tax=Candidatus Lloydiibacteriota TaxID=1817910 RepID=A0A1G2DMS1_9BACT|nr:MAG: hypothetical protein A3J08_01310 [Candidatus Lloydbacteria bacterium RIFCSPLOWO2_02_FULL_51_11]
MPYKKHTLIHIIAWSVAAAVSGLVFSAGISFFMEHVYENAVIPARLFASELLKGIADGKSEGIVDTPPFLAPKEGDAPTVLVPTKGKAVRVDFETGVVTLFSEGKEVGRFTARTHPDEFSPWRVLQGTYTVSARTNTHYSPLAGASFKDAVLFAENGMLRAAEEGEKNLPAHAGFALAEADAHAVFTFADEATKVLVLNEVSEARALSYARAREGLSKDTRAPKVSARATLVADLDTGEVFFEKSADKALPLASLSKLFTILVAQNLITPETRIAVSPTSFYTYGGNGGLRVGDVFSRDELFYPLIIESSNDAAEALAEAAGREPFIRAMNDLAKTLGLTNTVFADPSGLSPKNISTARDLFLLAQNLLKEHEDVLALTTLASFTLPAGDTREWSRTWRTNNEFVRDGHAYLLGSKNGYTDEAAQTTLSLFSLPISETEERRIAVVLLGSGAREGDTESLLRFADTGTLYSNPHFAETFTTQAKEYARRADAENPEFRLAFFRAPEGGGSRDTFAHLSGFKSYDALFADVEGIIGETGYNIVGEAALRTPKDFLQEFSVAGVDVVHVANAHAGDWGRSAFGEYVSILKRAGIIPAGGSEGALDRRETPVITRAGISVGFLSFSDAGPEWLAEDEYLPSILSAKDPHFAERINTAAKGSDHLVVGITLSAGGRSSSLGPSSGGASPLAGQAGGDVSSDADARKRALAHAAVNAGARVVIGFSKTENPETEQYHGGVIFYGQKDFSPLSVVFGKDGVTRVADGKDVAVK